MENLQFNIIDILALAVAVYEAISRTIPTVKNWTILGNVINFIKKISDLLDKRDEDKPKRKLRGSKS